MIFYNLKKNNNATVVKMKLISWFLIIVLPVDFSYPDLDSGFLASPTNPDTSTPLQPEPVRIIPKDATDSNTNSNIYKKTTDSNSNIYKKTTDSNIKYPQVPNLPALHNGSIAPKKIPPTSSSSSGGSAPPSVDRKSKPAGENSSQEVNGINGILPSPSHTINNNNNNNVIPTVPSRSLKPRELLDGFKGAMAKEEKLMEDTMELEKVCIIIIFISSKNLYHEFLIIVVMFISIFIWCPLTWDR